MPIFTKRFLLTVRASLPTALPDTANANTVMADDLEVDLLLAVVNDGRVVDAVLCAADDGSRWNRVEDKKGGANASPS